ncbi:dihydrofolate reductase family protein [Pedobacter sp. B4-66]|uniref:dihydrofolate reductase family protein n=1 Tax=Pedobacter sp. B4-66 TaxID=2817280 RepID=UPI001BDB51AB|nr:dihydrofolate reductase family protein [Pedobacter sp. B4-66]
MRKVILALAVSLDGFIEGPNREVDWITFDEETANELNEFAKEIDTVLYGRVSYQLFGNYCPDDNGPDFEKKFYSEINKMQKYVFSKTQTEFEGAPIAISSGIGQVIQDLKKQEGKDIWLFGGAGLISSLLNLNLVDEIRIGIHPIVLGAGNPLFKTISQQIKLKLLKATTGKSGVVGLYYKVEQHKDY